MTKMNIDRIIFLTLLTALFNSFVWVEEKKFQDLCLNLQAHPGPHVNDSE
jgi:hypothetical protein